MEDRWGFEKIKDLSCQLGKNKRVVKSQREKKRRVDQWREEDLENVRVQEKKTAKENRKKKNLPNKTRLKARKISAF